MFKHNSGIVVIGCGYWGSIIIHNLNKIIKSKIYIFDINTKNSSNLKKKIPNLNVLKNLNEVLKNESIKNFFLITPPEQNYILVKKLLINNKNVFVEKPFLTSKQQYHNIEKILKKQNNILMIGYIYIYNDFIKYIKKIINTQKLGKILFIKSVRENLGPVRNKVDCNYDLASHDISIIKYLFDQKKLKLKSKISHKILKKNISDISTLELTLEDINVEIRTSWLNPEKIRKLIIVGTKKMLLYDETNFKNELTIFNQYAEYPEIQSLGNKIFSEKARVYKGKKKIIKIKNSSPLVNELKYFLRCSKKKQIPVTNIKFGLDVIKVLETNKN